MTSGPAPICLLCEHLKSPTETGQGTFRCIAFPRKIPERILLGGYDHRKPYSGDKGIQFKLKKGEKEPPVPLPFV